MNYAGLAPLRPQSYLKSLFARELLGNAFLPKWSGQVRGLRDKVALWLGCEPDQVAFVPSTSIGLMTAAYALDWRPGDVALYPAGDFPANVLPWQALSRFQVRPVGVKDWRALLAEHGSDSGPESNSGAGPNLELDRGPDFGPPQTRMVALSTVDYATGIEQPWREVITRAASRNIWTCLDAVQSAGVKPAWDPAVDFWCAGSQKWLVSGLGVAILVLSRRVLAELAPPFPNWLGLNDPPTIESGMDGTAHGWECGWISPAALTRLEVNLDYFSRIGWETVTAKVKSRRDYLHEQLLEAGWRVVSCPSRWSGIVSFDPGPGLAARIVQDGYRHRIITAQRGDLVRLSPHIFNSMRQLKQVARWLHECRNAFP